MRKFWLIVVLFKSSPIWAGIPATPVMTLYQFNGAVEIPYYDVETFSQVGASSPAGTLTQGTSVIPCLVIRDGQPLMDSGGTPYVGFQVVVDSRTATRSATETFKRVLGQRKTMRLTNHHCDGNVKHVIDVRKLYALEKAPFFEPPIAGGAKSATLPTQGEPDRIVRAFHASPYCESANGRLLGRRAALESAWQRFAQDNSNRWSIRALEQARHLDYTMRTAIFEGHLDRGCNAYGGCERNIIALSIRNRAREGCSRSQGCNGEGDFRGVSSKVSHYNIWDEYLTQVSGLTSCFLRDELSGARSPNAEYFGKLRGIYEQNLGDVQRILFGDDQDLSEIFPNVSMTDLKSLKHYYHAPAMGKCFPTDDRVIYVSGAVARKGNDFALIANTRIRVDERMGDGYHFREFVLEQNEDRDEVEIVNSFPGFLVDSRKVDFKATSRCAPYGIPPGCGVQEVGRYRTTPSWLNAGKPLELTCRIKDRGASCQGSGSLKTVRVGGVCDTQMRPVAGVK